MSVRRNPLSKDDVIRAMNITRSNKSASRYLGVSYQYYRQFAQLYVDQKSGKTLLELHKNQAGKGIQKRFKGENNFVIKDIIDGKIDQNSIRPERLKNQFIKEGYLHEECEICKFAERRTLDYKLPLLLHFRDGDKTHWIPSNLALFCYNCYYMYIGNVFTHTQIKGLEDHTSVKNIKIDWKIDNEYQLRRLEELDKMLGVASLPKPDDISGEELISRK